MTSIKPNANIRFAGGAAIAHRSHVTIAQCVEITTFVIQNACSVDWQYCTLVFPVITEHTRRLQTPRLQVGVCDMAGRSP